MQIDKIRRSLALGTTLVWVSFFSSPDAAADNRKSTVTVSVIVSPSCMINENGIDPVRCGKTTQPIVSLGAIPAPADAIASSGSIRTINF